jgi:hypothetical protein
LYLADHYFNKRTKVTSRSIAGDGARILLLIMKYYFKYNNFHTFAL